MCLNYCMCVFEFFFFNLNLKNAENRGNDRSAHAMQIEFKQKLKLLRLVNGLVDTNGVEV